MIEKERLYITVFFFVYKQVMCQEAQFFFFLLHTVGMLFCLYVLGIIRYHLKILFDGTLHFCPMTNALMIIRRQDWRSARISLGVTRGWQNLSVRLVPHICERCCLCVFCEMCLGMQSLRSFLKAHYWRDSELTGVNTQNKWQADESISSSIECKLIRFYLN